MTWGRGATPSASGTASESSGHSQPSSVASMVCSEDEIAEAVQHGFSLSDAPTGSGSWDAATRLYTCRYPLPHSVLTLQVKDIDGSAGRAWFEQARRTTPASTTIHGLQNLGFPAFQDHDGHVASSRTGRRFSSTPAR